MRECLDASQSGNNQEQREVETRCALPVSSAQKSSFLPSLRVVIVWLLHSETGLKESQWLQVLSPPQYTASTQLLSAVISILIVFLGLL